MADVLGCWVAFYEGDQLQEGFLGCVLAGLGFVWGRGGGGVVGLVVGYLFRGEVGWVLHNNKSLIVYRFYVRNSHIQKNINCEIRIMSFR